MAVTSTLIVTDVVEGHNLQIVTVTVMLTSVMLAMVAIVVMVQRLLVAVTVLVLAGQHEICDGRSGGELTLHVSLVVSLSHTRRAVQWSRTTLLQVQVLLK